MTETCYLLSRLTGDSDPALEFIQGGGAQLAFNLAAEFGVVKSLLTRYANVPMSLPDACLVRMSELHTDGLVLTTDSDFAIYRRQRNQTIPTLTPPA